MNKKRKVLFKIQDAPIVLFLTDEKTEELQNAAKIIMYEMKTLKMEEFMEAIDSYWTSNDFKGRVLWFYKDDELELKAIGTDEIVDLGDYKRKHTCVSLNCPFIDHCKEYNFLVDRGKVCEIQTWFLKKAKQLIKEQEDKG